MIKKLSSFLLCLYLQKQLLTNLASVLVVHSSNPLIKYKHLGVYLDNHMNMSASISEIVRCCYFHINHIGQINKFQPRQTRERVVNALVTSRLDYSNSLLYGTADKNFARLHHLQNTAARLIMHVPNYSNITPVLKELHWLPVISR